MSEQSAVERSGAPATVDSLAADLRALGLQPGTTVLMHSSLSALGWVCGGAVAVLQALERVLGPQGTLVVPTFSTGLSEPSLWRSPPVPPSWWDSIRAAMPAYDPAITPTRMMGAAANCLRTWPGTHRSAHPQLSFAARGPQAGAILAGHALDHPLGERSPLARIYERDGWVLLLGVGHANNTSLHLAEQRADWPGRRTVRQGAPVLDEGQRRWVTFEMLDPDDSDFEALGADFARETGLERVGPAGAGQARLMPQRALVDFGAAWLAGHRTASAP